MRRLLILLLFAVPTLAQVPATVTGLITDAGNNPATSGFVQFDVIPTASSIHYFVAGFGTITQTTQCGINASGQVLNLALSGACTVWGNDLINPANTQYKITFAPNGSISNVVSGECITGSSYSLNNPVFCPRVQISPQQAVVRSNPFATNIIPLVDNTFTIGSPVSRWSNGYFTNLFLNGVQLQGNNIALLSGATNNFSNINVFNSNSTHNGIETFKGLVNFDIVTPSAVNSPTWSRNGVPKWNTYLDGSNSLCFFDAVNNKVTICYLPNVGALQATEGPAPTGFPTLDTFWPDSTAHRWRMSNNSNIPDNVLGANTTDTLTNKTINGPSGLLYSPITPTISSGFGTSPVVGPGNGTATFNIAIGTGGVATNGVVSLPTATNGWTCWAVDITTQSATVFVTKQIASTTGSATLANFNTAGAQAAWVANDILFISCWGR